MVAARAAVLQAAAEANEEAEMVALKEARLAVSPARDTVAVALMVGY